MKSVKFRRCTWATKETAKATGLLEADRNLLSHFRRP